MPAQKQGRSAGSRSALGRRSSDNALRPHALAPPGRSNLVRMGQQSCHEGLRPAGYDFNLLP